MADKTRADSTPEFTATDTEGRTVRLSDFRGSKNVFLVFNRGFK
jgi:peroxiredoxin